ncbi:hypothetical protein BpHYR1_028510 [Brachionus plicatilis]|uniref:Uncharacterized protein n=1 Tax=Brachionus plicatilis TaxID=10195 RepID=A0A3M7Q2U7_BRAPC|nr:hypothetical protein BpHYR1_028510 [Brachionus plicatilis]
MNKSNQRSILPYIPYQLVSSQYPQMQYQQYLHNTNQYYNFFNCFYYPYAFSIKTKKIVIVNKRLIINNKQKD